MPYSPEGLLRVPPGSTVTTLGNPGVTKLQAHRKVKDPLFTRPPSMADVIQGEIGDCYVLAALNAVLSMPDGPEIILHLMRDNGDGTVTMRLYRSGAFHYVRVEKSVVHEAKSLFLGRRVGTGKTLHGFGAPWVSLFEKAFLAFIRDQRASSYKGIEEGDGAEPLAAILGPGLDLKGDSAAGVDAAFDAYHAARRAWETLVNTINAQGARTKTRFYRDNAAAIAALVFAEVPDADGHVERWAKGNTGDANRALGLIQPKGQTAGEFEKRYKAATARFDPLTAELVRIWVHGSGLLPGEVGSGRYTVDQLNRFARIQRILATRRPVVASSKQKLPGVASGEGHSGGEAMVDGLAGKHAYSVLDTKTDPLGRRFLLLRNPWGRYGRSYQSETRRNDETGPATLKPVAVEDKAESWIELTDYCLNFTGESAGAPAHGGARQALMTNLDQQLAAQKAKLKPVAPAPKRG